MNYFENDKDIKDLPAKLMSIQDAIDQVKDVRMQRKLQIWLQTFDLAKIQSFQELGNAYQGIFRLTACCGHVNAGIRSTCQILLKCLMGYQMAYKEFLQYEFPQELLEQVRKEMEKYQNALKQVLSSTDYAKLERSLKQTRIEE